MVIIFLGPRFFMESVMTTSTSSYAWHFLIDIRTKVLLHFCVITCSSFNSVYFEGDQTAGKIWRETLLMSLAKVITLAILGTHKNEVNIAVYGLLWISVSLVSCAPPPGAPAATNHDEGGGRASSVFCGSSVFGRSIEMMMLSSSLSRGDNIICYNMGFQRLE